MSETFVDTVRRMLRYDAISGELFWIAGKRVGKRAGYVNADGYVKVHVNGKAVPAQKIAWVLAYGFEPNGIVDHEDRVRSNNRLANLRIATASQNCANSPARNPTRMNRHIANILEEGELDEPTSLQKTQTSLGRPSLLYSLDMVISVGYRVSSAQATVFRRWATTVLVQFAKKGFVVDAPRLKQPENSDRIAELREIIRDIRADEANVYRELKRICAMCQDYDPASDASREFYQHTQAKLVYAVVSHTPAEIIASRANHQAENMGSWGRRYVPVSECGFAPARLSRSRHPHRQGEGQCRLRSWWRNARGHCARPQAGRSKCLRRKASGHAVMKPAPSSAAHWNMRRGRRFNSWRKMSRRRREPKSERQKRDDLAMFSGMARQQR